MTQVIFSIPDEAAVLITESFCESFGYSSTLPDGSDNKQTPQEFAQGKVIAYCRSVVQEFQFLKAKRIVEEQLKKQMDSFDIQVETK